MRVFRYLPDHIIIDHTKNNTRFYYVISVVDCLGDWNWGFKWATLQVACENRAQAHLDAPSLTLLNVNKNYIMYVRGVLVCTFAFWRAAQWSFIHHDVFSHGLKPHKFNLLQLNLFKQKIINLTIIHRLMDG